MKQRENDADRFAVDHFLSELTQDNERMVRLFGILVLYLCLLIGKKHRSLSESPTHPDVATRILRVLSYDVADEGFRDSLRGAVMLALTYFLDRQGVSMMGKEFDGSEAALEHCINVFDELRSLRS